MLHGTADFAAYEEYWNQLQAFAGRMNLAAPNTDPHQAGQLFRQDLGQNGRVIIGRVVDAIGYTHWYKVMPEHGNATIACCRLSSTSLMPSGTKEIGHLSPDTPVLIYCHPSCPYGFILGVVPDYGASPLIKWSGWIAQGGGTNFKTEPAHNHPLSLLSHGGIIDFSSGRPIDASTGGEWGYMAETGLGILIDPFMAYLRVDEVCGLFMFYWDQLTRLTGHNLELRSAGTLMQSLDDEGETNVIEGATPYFWEALGAWSLDPRIHSTNTDRQVQIDKPYLAKIEPVEGALQQPFYRLSQYRGYLGQGAKRQLILPGDHEGWQGALGPQGCQDVTTEPGEVNRYDLETAFPGVFDESLLLTGRLAMRSAKGISIVKRPIIPVPKQINLPENPVGDNSANYRAAGRQGLGPQHVVGELQVDEMEGPQGPQGAPVANLFTAAGLLDLHAYVFNWEGLHPFHYHTNDWYLPEESEIPDMGSNFEIPAWSALSDSPYLSRPVPQKLPIDHRYDAVNDSKIDYYPNTSYLELLDDGGVLLGDGYGAELRMTGGSIHITCPGDIWLQSGKNVNSWAGDDCILRARSSVDISAAEHDVRLKAEENMQLVGGNSGETGGVLIESRATCFGTHRYSMTDEGPQAIVSPVDGEDVASSGIVLRAGHSQIVAYSAQIYLRTGISEGGVDDGDIILDAAKGAGSIRTVSCNFDRFVGSPGAQGPQDPGGYIRDFFGLPPVAGNFYSKEMNYFWGGICVDGPSEIDGDLLVFGSVGATGNFASKLACTDKASKLVCCWTGAPQGPQCEAIMENELIKGQTLFESEIEELMWAEDKVGHEDTELHIQFAFRVTVDYNTANFVLFENRWQQLARLAGSVPNRWLENPAPDWIGNLTYPHPGLDAWKRESRFYELDPQLYNAVLGQSVSRNDPLYQDPVYAAPVTRVLDGHYPII